MKTKFQGFLMLALILVSHVNHVSSTILDNMKVSGKTNDQLQGEPKPRELHRRRKHRHRKRRHMRHNKNSLKVTSPYAYQKFMTPMGAAYAANNHALLKGHRGLFDIGGMAGSLTSGLGDAVGGVVGGAGAGVGDAVAGAGEGVGNAAEGAGEGATGILGGVGNAVGSIGGGIDAAGDSVGSALGMGDNAGTGLAVGAAAAGAGYYMRQRRQKIHKAKVRMLDQKIAMKEFQSNLVDQEYQLLLHANRDLHAANGRVSNLERNAVYRINARILDYAIGAYY